MTNPSSELNHKIYIMSYVWMAFHLVLIVIGAGIDGIYAMKILSSWWKL